jgi:hypothetical protein
MSAREHILGLEAQLNSGVQRWNLREPFSFGAIYRRQIRAALDSYGLRSNEYRGLLGSEFIVLVSTRTEMANYIAFSKKMLTWMANIKAREIMEEREGLIKQNRNRKLTFRAPLHVPFDGKSEEEITAAVLYSM